MQHGFDLSRRDFVKTAVAAGATMGSLTALGQQTAGGAKTFRVALVGCGGRGKGALGNCMEAAKQLGVNLTLVAAADYFGDRAVDAGKRNGLAADKCFGGADGYRKAMAEKPDIVVMAPPPNFRPLHLDAAIEAGAHVFMEKPVAVDPPGARRIIATGEKAKAKGLAIVAGTQRRHQDSYLRNQYAVANGAVGQILGGTIHWCGRVPWERTRNEGESDGDYLIRNWVNFTELSGDHLVEQHVHNIDIANWFIGRPPEAVLGFGGRARRRTGNQYDFFSLDFDYGDGCHIHSMCRQISGTYSRVGESFVGTAGQVMGGGRLDAGSGKAIEIPAFPQGNPYVLEHVALLEGILKGSPINEARNVAEATMAAVMGRMSAYTGQLIRWSDVMENEKSPWFNFACTPTAEDFESGDVKAPAEVPAVPGHA